MTLVNTVHTAEGGGNSSGEIFATRQRIFPCDQRRHRKPDRQPHDASQPRRHLANAGEVRRGDEGVLNYGHHALTGFGRLKRLLTSFETTA